MPLKRKKSIDVESLPIKLNHVKQIHVWGKKIIGSAIRFMPNIQHRIEKGLTVFAFHDVSNSPSKFTQQYGLVVSTETFERQIRWIRDNFEILHPSAILGPKPIPRRGAVISFDDGYRGAFDNGLPILEKLNIPAVIFLNMQAIILKKPIISAISCFLSEMNPNFTNHCRQGGLKSPFHLSPHPH